jgi:hypothetical protein
MAPRAGRVWPRLTRLTLGAQALGVSDPWLRRLRAGVRRCAGAGAAVEMRSVGMRRGAVRRPAHGDACSGAPACARVVVRRRTFDHRLRTWRERASLD